MNDETWNINFRSSNFEFWKFRLFPNPNLELVPNLVPNLKIEPDRPEPNLTELRRINFEKERKGKEKDPVPVPSPSPPRQSIMNHDSFMAIGELEVKYNHADSLDSLQSHAIIYCPVSRHIFYNLRTFDLSKTHAPEAPIHKMADHVHSKLSRRNF